MDDVNIPRRRLRRRLLAQNQRIRVPRLFRDRTDPLQIFRPDQIRKKYRFWPHQIIQLENLLHDDIAPLSERSHAIPAIVKLCAALRFYACGTYLDVVGDVMGISESSVCV
jgi:hypothetical protein